MKGYVAKKRCILNGVAYKVGDPVPFEAIAPGRAAKLIDAGVIAEVNMPDNEGSARIEIPIIKDNETMTVELTADEIVQGVCLLQSNAEEAEKEVKTINNMDLLIFIDRLETRKTVKQALKERAEKLMKQGDE